MHVDQDKLIGEISSGRSDQGIALTSDVSNLIRFIIEPSIEVQLSVVRRDPNSIYYIKNPSLEVQLLAVRRSPYSIKWIKNPSFETQWLSVELSEYVIDQIKNPYPEIQLKAVMKHIASLKRNGNIIRPFIGKARASEYLGINIDRLSSLVIDYLKSIKLYYSLEGNNNE